jgi:DNA-directed RNA polymerase subunit beta
MAKQIAKLSRKTVKVLPFVSSEIVYLPADKEEEYVIAQANAPLTDQDHFSEGKVEVRKGNRFYRETPEHIDFMDVSSKQIVGVSASLIPFLQHDDANRALMGSNMERQAVPLLCPESPMVGTGMERQVARDSGQLILAEADGEVVSVAGSGIAVRNDSGEEQVYPLLKFVRTNQGTCINQHPIVLKGQRVHEGQVLADSSATDDGILSLGQNVLCGFMSWEGYNFEDAIIVSERIVRDDKFTSIHIERYEVEARETKLGAEEITRDIPNVGEESLRKLDDDGIIQVGATVESGDILVGKITPKGETELTAEEKLLRVIFGEKAREVKDTSLRVPHGEKGLVIAVKTFVNRDELPEGVSKLVRVWIAQKRKGSEGDKLAGRHGNKGVIARILPVEDMPFLPDGTPLDIILNPIGVPSRMNLGQIFEAHLGWAANELGFKCDCPVFEGPDTAIIEDALAKAWIVRQANSNSTNLVSDPDERLRCAESWLESRGENPAEVFGPDHAGNARWVCLRLWLKDQGISVKGLSNRQVQHQVDKIAREKQVSPPIYGKTTLYDGRTGTPFDQPVTVGYVYVMKLIHLVEDKVHARSTGPYTLITQQPLGGKAQFGGQRFGEMEVWALEAYGAAYTLQELLTIKSDDIAGRAKAYEAITKGDDVHPPGLPESFNVLVRELQSLGLAVELSSGEKI